MYKNEAIIDNIEIATPNVIELQSVTLNVQVGDMLEFRIDPAALGGRSARYESRPEAANWTWVGHSMVYPVIGVVVGGGNTTVTLMYPLLSTTVTDIRARIGDNIRAIFPKNVRHSSPSSIGTTSQTAISTR